jgi:hypothetical protein
MRNTFLTTALFAASGCITQRHSRTPDVEGTYEIAVCKVGRCAPGDTAVTLTQGILVLFATRLPPVPDSAINLLRLPFLAEGNMCFALEPRRPGSQTYAGLAGVEATRWQPDSATGQRITFSLYFSPDAGHEVTARIRHGTLGGRGTSWGAGVAAVEYPPDTIVGRRLGPPDITPCVAASAREWRRIMSSRPPPNER